MNGKDIFLGLKYIGEDLIEEAEYGQFSSQAGRHVKQHAGPRKFRRPLLIAALIAMMLLLVGCAVVYALTVQDLKVDEQVGVVYSVDGDTNIAAETVEVQQQVLTLTGLDGSPAYIAAKEWYDFKQSYDPDHSIIVKLQSEGKIPEFPREYDAYGIYTQEMKDKLDQIVEKYDLNLMGPTVKFRTAQQLCRALGMENILSSGSEASMKIKYGTYYACGNLNLGYDISLPGEEGTEPVDTWGELYYRRKDCFADDVKVIGSGALIGDNYGVKEWNYTTKDGNTVLIVRSSSDWRAWIFCDQPDMTISMMAEARFEYYSDDAGGNAIIESVEMTDRQLELLAENIDFSVQPQLDQSADLTGGAVEEGETVDGYTMKLKSAITDGYVAYVTLNITAPEDVVLLKPELGPFQLGYGNGYGSILTPVNAAEEDQGGSITTWAEDDGDGRDNTCDLVIGLEYTWEKGAAPFAADRIWNLYFENLIRSHWDSKKLDTVEETLAEGTWTFDLAFEGEDTRALELVQEPITTNTISGRENGKWIYEDVEVYAFTLRSLSATIRYEEYSSAYFTNGTDDVIYAVMKDGSRIELSSSHGGTGSLELTAESPIDLDQADHVLLADGTKLPVFENGEE